MWENGKNQRTIKIKNRIIYKYVVQVKVNMGR